MGFHWLRQTGTFLGVSFGHPRSVFILPILRVFCLFSKGKSHGFPVCFMFLFKGFARVLSFFSIFSQRFLRIWGTLIFGKGLRWKPRRFTSQVVRFFYRPILALQAIQEVLRTMERGSGCFCFFGFVVISMVFVSFCFALYYCNVLFCYSFTWCTTRFFAVFLVRFGAPFHYSV